jgi:hypothetical protein
LRSLAQSHAADGAGDACGAREATEAHPLWSCVGGAGMTPYDGRKVHGPRCRLCEILLDVPCTHPTCDGHRNDRVGDVCRYCATEERGQTLFVREVATLFFSSLGDIGHGEE